MLNYKCSGYITTTVQNSTVKKQGVINIVLLTHPSISYLQKGNYYKLLFTVCFSLLTKPIVNFNLLIEHLSLPPL